MTSENAWNALRIRELVHARFAKRACYFQIQVALALYEKNDVIACAPTGAGKTLSFWIPLLMAKADGLQRMSFVITPLNVLGEQNARELGLAGIRAVAVNGKNMASSLWKEIEDGRYEVVIISPELMIGCGELRKLWQTPKFTSKILNIIIDEGHCVSHILFYVASATLPTTLLAEIKTILGLRSLKTKEFLYSNDRPEIALFGRAARGAGETATAILLVEKKDTDEFRLAKKKRAKAKAVAAAARASRKRKATDVAASTSERRPRKRAAHGERPVEVPDQSSADPSEISREGGEGESIEQNGNNGDGSGNVNDDDNDSGNGGDSGGNDADRLAAGSSGMGLEGSITGDGLMDVETRSQHYANVGGSRPTNHVGQSAQSKSRQVVLDSPMDDFINARIRGARCLRVVPSAYFGNNKRATSNHIHPGAFSQYSVPPSKSTAAPKKSSVKLSPKADHLKMDALLNALYAWRTAKAKVEFGHKLIRMYGTMLFVPDEVLHRTVLCAQAGKITSVESLRREIGWAMNWAEKYLESLLDVVFEFYPSTATQSTTTATSHEGSARAPATELTPHNPNVPQGPPPPKRTRTIRCGACHQIGHNRANVSCPKNKENRASRFAADDENRRPSTVPIPSNPSNPQTS
ncbi:hypothetical protein ONZ45_g7145 [Pleurotus djamor]|nr:hypothetical protein ONZ45_g7145 [Pleurotus djamor]